MTIETFLLLLWLQACSSFYKVEPELIKAVADVECNVTEGFKIGNIDKKGNFIGPMGLYKGCKIEGNIYNPYNNIRIGTERLAYLIDKYGSKKKALKVYNPKLTMAYYNSVMRRYRFYKKEGLR